MRTMRFVRGVSAISKWPWCAVGGSQLRGFTSTTGVLMTKLSSSLQEQYDADEWSSFETTSSVLHIKSISNEESSSGNHHHHHLPGAPVSDIKVAPGPVPPVISVSDQSGRIFPVTPFTQFSELKDIPEWLEQGLKNLKYPSATSIQGYTIPVLDEGHDLIGLAPTGSGKTVAFAVPALKHFKPSPSGLPRILVLAPTRELVQQTSKVFQQLSCGSVRVCEAYGGAPREIQARRLHNGCDVLVACPGRLRDFLQNGDVSLDDVSFLVFDEADRLLDMGFRVQLDEILGYFDLSRRVQTMMWSATWPKAVEDLADNYLLPERLTVRAGTAGTGLQVNSNIKQNILFAEHPQERMDALVSLMQNGTIDDATAKIIMFVERQTDTDNAAHLMVRKLGVHPKTISVIHGGMQQRQRDYIMNSFKTNRSRILIATDVASRGLDIPDVTCVVNFMAPKNIDSYCHRIGRTGRAGRKGDAFTFIGRSDGGLAKDLVDYLQKCGMEVPSKLVELADRYFQIEEDRQSKRRWNRPGRDSRKKPYWKSNISDNSGSKSASYGSDEW